ncbi:MAG TPA: hydroxymethylbilane synthase [Vicinamibacterales bacterium]|nr:hydroxymethylbilane synthase [Vicinamibacterales bacterium]
MRPRRIGTRGSALALWQAKAVASRLQEGGTPTEIVVIKTGGDRLQEAPLSEAGGKRLFVKELEDALLSGDVDLAVHSAKDMSAVLPDGLTIAAVLPRDDPRDALVLTRDTRVVDFEAALAHIGETPSIATGSIRRIAQLSALLPQARFLPIRGNVDTRLRKLDAGEYEALILAVAGLRRLGFDARISAAIPVEVCIPAPGQGIVAVEIRDGDGETRRMVTPIGDAEAAASLAAERAVVTALGGGCQLPLGAVAVHDRDSLSVHAVVASPDGRDVIRRTVSGLTGQAAALGRQVAEELVTAGATEILSAVRNGVMP